MKKKSFSLLIGCLLLLIFIAVLFLFQVRTTEVAVVTTFGSYSRSITNAGLYVRWPLPIQKVYRFDNRLQSFEKNFVETTTKDAKNILIAVYVGWKVSDPQKFLERFNGDSIKAEQALETLLREAKTGVVGTYNFSDLVSPDPKQVKFDDIETDILKRIQPRAQQEYGVQVDLVGIKQLGLPESITAKVFERMKAERDQLVAKYKGEGQQIAISINSEAQRRRTELLASANAAAKRTLGEADKAAAKDYEVFEQEPELAKFLLQNEAFREILTNRATLILDSDMSPFNLLRGDKITGGANK